MPPDPLVSQFADLEEPTPDEPALRINIGPAPAVIADEIVRTFALDEKYIDPTRWVQGRSMFGTHQLNVANAAGIAFVPTRL